MQIYLNIVLEHYVQIFFVVKEHIVGKVLMKINGKIDVKIIQFLGFVNQSARFGMPESAEQIKSSVFDILHTIGNVLRHFFLIERIFQNLGKNKKVEKLKEYRFYEKNF